MNKPLLSPPRSPIRRSAVVADLVAGLVLGIVTLPFCFGFGLIAFGPLGAGETPLAVRAGLVGGILAALTTSLLGGTRSQVSAPVIAGSLMIAEVLGRLLTGPELQSTGSNLQTVAIALIGATIVLSALFQLLFGLLRLGNLVRYLAYPVVAGLMAAIAFLTVKGQLLEFIGPLTATGPAGQSPPTVAIATVATGFVTLIVLLQAGRILPAVPGPLKGLVVGLAVALALRLGLGPDWTAPTLQSTSVSLPPFIDFRQAWDLVRQLGPFWVFGAIVVPAFSMALFSSLNSLVSASAVDALTGEEHSPTQELLTQGTGNLAIGMVAGVPGAGLISLSTLNWHCGGRGRLAGLTQGLTLLFCMFVCMPLLDFVPRVVLAAIVMQTGFKLVDPWVGRLVRALRHPDRGSDRGDSLINLCIVLLVASAVVVTGLVWGMLIGLLTSSIHFVARVGRVRYRLSYRGNVVHSKRARPESELKTLAIQGDSIAVFELAGSIFFGSADKLVKRIRVDAGKASTIIIGLKAVDEIDASGLRVLLQYMRRVQKEGRQVLIGHLSPGHRLWNRLRDMGVQSEEMSRNFFPSTDAALEWSEDRLLGNRQSSDDNELPLNQVELLRGLPAGMVSQLEHQLSRTRYPAGTAIVRAGEGDRTLYILAAGRVSVWTDHGVEHQETRLAGFSAGMAFGEIALLDAGPRTATVIAEVDSVCRELSYEAFQRLRSESPDLALQLVENLALSLAKRLRLATAQIRTLLS